MVAMEEPHEAIETFLVTYLVELGFSQELVDNFATEAIEAVRGELTGVRGNLIKATIQARHHNERIIQSQLLVDETCLAFVNAETKTPFLIEIIPLVGSILQNNRKFLIAVTDLRLLILEIKQPLNFFKDTEFKRLTASIPLGNVHSIEPKRGVLDSKVIIRADNGKKYNFSNMLKPSAHQLAEDFRATREAYGNLSRNETVEYTT